MRSLVAFLPWWRGRACCGWLWEGPSKAQGQLVPVGKGLETGRQPSRHPCLASLCRKQEPALGQSSGAALTASLLAAARPVPRNLLAGGAPCPLVHRVCEGGASAVRQGRGDPAAKCAAGGQSSFHGVLLMFCLQSS